MDFFLMKEFITIVTVLNKPIRGGSQPKKLFIKITTNEGSNIKIGQSK